MNYRVVVEWTIVGEFPVEADTEEDALRIVQEDEDWPNWAYAKNLETVNWLHSIVLD